MTEKKKLSVINTVSIVAMLATLRISFYTYKTGDNLGLLPQKYLNYILYAKI